jgi:hypothetical protein
MFTVMPCKCAAMTKDPENQLENQPVYTQINPLTKYNLCTREIQ